jgi:hypothetical protein
LGRFLTIAGPAETTANLAIITTAELHSYRATTGATGDDVRLGMVVEWVNHAVYEYLRRRFLNATGTNWELVMDGPPPGRPLILPHKPINTFVSLERGHYDAGGWTTDHLFTASEIVVENTGRITAVGTQWFSPSRLSMRVVYESGWTTVPRDIHAATLIWASVEYERASGQRHDHISRAFEGGSDSYTFDTIPTGARRILDRYRRKEKLVGA